MRLRDRSRPSAKRRDKTEFRDTGQANIRRTPLPSRRLRFCLCRKEFEFPLPFARAFRICAAADCMKPRANRAERNLLRSTRDRKRGRILLLRAAPRFRKPGKPVKPLMPLENFSARCSILLQLTFSVFALCSFSCLRRENSSSRARQSPAGRAKTFHGLAR